MTCSAINHPFRAQSRVLALRAVASKPKRTLSFHGLTDSPVTSDRLSSHYHEEHHQRSRRRRYHNKSQNNQYDRNPYTAIPIISFFLPAFWRSGSDDSPDLSPFKYTSQRVSSIKKISPQHVLIDIPISSRSREAFRNGTSTSTDPSGDASGTLDVFHVYVKSPDLQIERPYTPINDVEKDGYIRLLVKRVKGGEVGRYLHSLGEGDDVEIRGPIKTVSVPVHSLDHLTMISTGTGVAPFLQLLCKVANRSKTATQTESPDSPQSVRPKLSLIQYLPRNGHAVPPTGNPSQTATESLPAEEFSELDSSSDAGPDIIRHPDVLSPLLRKQLTDAGALRLMRVRPGGTIDSPVLMDSLETTKKTEPAVENSVKSGEAQVSNGIGSWFSWLSSSNSDPQTDKAIPHSTVQEVKLRDGRLGDERAGVMICLPVNSLIPLAGPQFPMGRMKPPIAGVLGNMGFTRDNVWIL